MNNRGNILLALVFATLILFAGLTLLTLSYTHERIVGARTKKTLRTSKVFQDTHFCLHLLREKIFKQNIPAPGDPVKEYFNTLHFPTQNINGTRISHTFTQREIENSQQTFRNTIVTDTVHASEILYDNSRAPYRVRAEVRIDILHGHIPITKFPIFINKKSDTAPGKYFQENNISTTDGKKCVLENSENQPGIQGLIKAILHIDSPGTISWQDIRETLGLQRNQDPIEPGIHIAFHHHTVHSIIIGGDIERIVFFTHGEMQGITLYYENQEYRVYYRPGESSFDCWDPLVPRQAFFEENLIILGNALAIEQEGKEAFLETANIKLLVSGVAVISSNLETRKCEIRGDKITNFTLLNDFPSLPGLDEQGGGIIIDTGDNNIDEEETKNRLEATLITSGKLTVTGDSRLDIAGSLYATDLDNQGIVDITYREAAFDSASYYTIKNYVYINNFIINYIEEINDEEIRSTKNL